MELTGRRIAAHLLPHGTKVVICDPAAPDTPRGVLKVGHAADLAVTDVVALCHPHPHAQLAAEYLAAGVSVVSMSDDIADVRTLVDLDDRARRGHAVLVVGAAMSPGLSGLLIDHLWRQLDVAEEIHVATHGTAGPACAAQHHDALGDTAIGWHDGAWIERPGGSGRELNWFPEPIGAKDCYRAALPDPFLLQRMFPTASRISARVSGTRRDRLTARLPMLTPPHAAGDLGAVRVEVRGAAADGARVTVIAGASGPTGDSGCGCCGGVHRGLPRGFDRAGCPPGRRIDARLGRTAAAGRGRWESGCRSSPALPDRRRGSGMPIPFES